MALETIAIQDKSLAGIAEKVQHGERLTLEDGVTLFNSHDLLTIGQLANLVNQRKNGDNVYFVQNMYINPTNVCEAHCKFCGFRRDKDQDGAYTMNTEELLHYVETRFHPGIREFHIVGGHNQHMPFEYYIDTLRTLKKAYPNVTLKSYTGAEIEFFSRISGLSIEGVLKELMNAGLESLTGGGAEILTERYRMKMSPEKASTDMYLQVHRTAHQLGLKTHSTMLYGSIETLEERVIHMLRLRELQDETNGFMVFIPLAVQPIKASAGIKRRNSAIDDLKTMAISRLMLDNFPHIKAYFINIGTQLTQLSLTMGMSDVHGTLVEERISHAAGALTQQALTVDELVWLVKGAGKRALERDTFYNVVKEH
ncbi:MULTISPECIES: aminofutalosine synthase MqnE [Brevibacillus]|jgi:aminodeoxyfutalosine synthase|uniref:Aminodeoxyfutalosine synthase n=2 Tax=Brevibacillus TaxID=55080 RepID=A0A1I3ZMQ7_9BACL|nr:MULTISPECIES: aminofutalosine synthase MqnE [Brevibacillus]MDR7316884.1 aminodeoxyfutalosine synthase [Brevibacillus nitrificans]MEC2127931.1 aminofutalosine synthase MqnE [Brevibacillus centrosporus]MED1792031.1 aminofutalosine synthase MqnE [Brevibacillus nitrificans]MED1953760.1 aminofutalosine synthase MqnE [Brevibacillus centrosporus]MED4911654.1 aminofutalosine synthase MqnE [Brevibacillus centrosporus]